jgi:hypothetical protein
LQKKFDHDGQRVGLIARQVIHDLESQEKRGCDIRGP